MVPTLLVSIWGAGGCETPNPMGTTQGPTVDEGPIAASDGELTEDDPITVQEQEKALFLIQTSSGAADCEVFAITPGRGGYDAETNALAMVTRRGTGVVDLTTGRLVLVMFPRNTNKDILGSLYPMIFGAAVCT
jgi:hypothetical protein